MENVIVDTHCHLDRLDLSPYDGDLNLALAAAMKKQVGYFLCVGIDLPTFPELLQIAKDHKNIWASVGIHPNEELESEPTVEDLVSLGNNPKIIAIGETGLDYYRDNTDKEIQQARFRTHIRAAIKLNKPIIVHTRQAREDTIKILKEEGAHKVGGIMHCFTEDLLTAEKAIEQNFYISFSGIITFQNAKELQSLVQQLPLEKMLVETDSPYLAPVPFRGKSNEPAYVYYVAEMIAKLKNLSFEHVAKQTTANFFHLFKNWAKPEKI